MSGILFWDTVVWKKLSRRYASINRPASPIPAKVALIMAVFVKRSVAQFSQLYSERCKIIMPPARAADIGICFFINAQSQIGCRRS